MQRIESILAIVDARSKDSLALMRALSLANQNASMLHVAVHTFEPAVSYNPLLTEEDIENIRSDECDGAKRWVERLLENNRMANVLVTIDVLWGQKNHRQVVQLCSKTLFDVVIISTPMLGSHRILTPSDWYLISHCPGPLLLVHRPQWWPNKPILASLELGEHTPEHIELNNIILEQSQIMAQCLGSALHVTHAYPKPPSYIEQGHPSITPWDYRQQFKQLIQERFDHCTARLKTSVSGQHLLEGSPCMVIERVVKQIDASILVLGMLAHLDDTTVSVGHIAELLITQVGTELLVVKPDGFFDGHAHE